MSIVRIIVYFVSGLLLISGAVCVGIFFHNGSVEAIGGAVMFFCFGGAGVLLSIFYNQILDLLRSESLS